MIGRASHEAAGETGGTKDGGAGRVVSTVQLPCTALWVSTMDTKLAGGVRNGGNGATGSGTAVRVGGGVEIGEVLANALSPASVGTAFAARKA